MGANHNATKEGVPGELLVQVSTGQFAFANYDINRPTSNSNQSQGLYPSLGMTYVCMDL